MAKILALPPKSLLLVIVVDPFVALFLEAPEDIDAAWVESSSVPVNYQRAVVFIWFRFYFTN